MGSWTWVALVLSGLILIFTAGFSGYTVGDFKGYDRGYDDGVVEGVGTGYTLRNPTYNEMKRFLAEDETDSKQYVDGVYTCSDFSADVNNNAEAQGLRAAVVFIDFPIERSHVVVAFETVDKGLIFIEPQFDDEIEVRTGISYSEANDYHRPSYNDTITKATVVW